MTSGCARPDGDCVEDCGEGFFADRESRDCEPCHAACRTCGGPQYDDCDSCRDGLKLKDGECLEQAQLTLCPEKHFPTSRSHSLGEHFVLRVFQQMYGITLRVCAHEQHERCFL